MKVLIIGGGGREHAVALALAKSPSVKKLWAAPGNGGTARICENVPLGACDMEGVLAFCRENRPDLVVVTPDDPLTLGMVDMLEKHGFSAFGPRARAAELEASKAFAKDFMQRHGIPTAACRVFRDKASALGYAKLCPLPVVVKADGLALGKGVIICHERQEALDAVEKLSASVSGSTLLFEEFLSGPEVSQLCFCDGEHVALMPASQDHKRAYDGDEGPNTGGMGAFSPVSVYTPELQGRCLREIILPTVRGMREDGREFRGVLYVSLMLTPQGPKVIEYNARFGDPETQAVLPLLESDLLEIMLAVHDGTLDGLRIRWLDKASCCVVMASGGYPGKYEKGFPIFGLENAAAYGTVFHAGTELRDGEYFTAGGRVLGVTAVADTLPEAVDLAYKGVFEIDFERAFFRRDIAKKDPLLGGGV